MVTAGLGQLVGGITHCVVVGRIGRQVAGDGHFVFGSDSVFGNGEGQIRRIGEPYLAEVAELVRHLITILLGVPFGDRYPV